MSAQDNVQIIRDKVQEVLKPLGFRRKNLTFIKELNDVLWLVNLQKSTKSTRDRLIFTVNFGIYSKTLAQKLDKPDKTATVWDCHWQERIGSLLPEHEDKWWDVTSVEEAEYYGIEVSAMILKYGIETLKSLESTEQLIKLWQSGIAPGLFEPLRIKYLQVLQTE